MPDATIEERLATLEAQVQGLADHIAEDIHGWDARYKMRWGLLDEDPEPTWMQEYDWHRDPHHPLHQAGCVDA